eukprot:TRINITY_DN3409_c0_g2_i1.p1 TRINITY_DN3409_c0_g2~~TRINITY_DN3409_c0_g2_i1.p1  ORF type:complete len:328 (-),score=74.78 TRINITY_DN3409_c0_g2_i1:193-1176(-)
MTSIILMNIMIISSLSDIFGTYNTGSSNQKVAVKDLSLILHKSECFGLLGPNGAGKTSLINLLTGNSKIDSGEIKISGYDIQKKPDQAFKKLGLCPQFDVLFDLLTGREHLKLFGSIKNIPKDQLDEQINFFIEKMELQDHADKQTKKYSGGTKRKLSVALALLGDNKLVFLDEPSTGMDSIAKRNMWEIINEMKKNRAIILTTHSMEEADALCENIGIMVKGSLQCIGGSQHLKSKFGTNYRLSIKTLKQRSEDVNDFVTELFPNNKITTSLGGVLHYDIPQEDINLAYTFQQLQDNRLRYDIQDYSLMNPSLEQVFLKFCAFTEE